MLLLRTGRRLFRVFWLTLIFTSALYSQTVPEWVLYPPRSATHFYAAGISPVYLSDSLSFHHARRHALSWLSRQHRVRVVSKLAEAERGARIRSFGYTVDLVDSTRYQQCQRHAMSLDSVLTEKYAFVLMAVSRDLSFPGSPDVMVHSRLISLDTLGHSGPDWILNPPEREGMVYGVGVSGTYRNMGDAWTQSARSALGDIAVNLTLQTSALRNEYVTSFQRYYRQWSEDESGITLEGAVITERWYDSRNGLYYTLISCSDNSYVPEE